ncbi:MAG: Fic family protein [Solirubrobacteraceae bacterium]
MLHYQFETLHPFLDGNARLGRLLIVFVLVEHGPLTVPVLYLSAYLEPDRERYCEALQTGDPLPWIELFLRAVHSQATDAVARAPSHDRAPEVQRRGARRARGARSRRPRRARSRPPAELQRSGEHRRSTSRHAHGLRDAGRLTTPAPREGTLHYAPFTSVYLCDTCHAM